MKKIVLYSNCVGGIIKAMFEKHEFTKDKFSINYIINYENLDKSLDKNHIDILNDCDIFLYQPFNQNFNESEYDITNIKKYLKKETIILKINYYRFKGFWFQSEYKPYNKYNNYIFNDIIDKINNIEIDKDEYLCFFNNSLEQFKNIDNNSDIKMFDYFIENYKFKRLFHDIYITQLIYFFMKCSVKLYLNY